MICFEFESIGVYQAPTETCVESEHGHLHTFTELKLIKRNHGSNEATMEKTAEGKVKKGDFLLWEAGGYKSHLETCSPSL